MFDPVTFDIIILFELICHFVITERLGFQVVRKTSEALFGLSV